MARAAREFAVVTGASTGIGSSVSIWLANVQSTATIFSSPRMNRRVNDAAAELRQHGTEVRALQVDLTDKAGVEKLYAATNGRPVEALLANAGRGLGRAFLDQNPDDWIRVAWDMRPAGSGRILITGSIAGFMPGTYQAVYNGTKSFLGSFSFALQHELKDSGVSVTCLMPGATEASRRKTIRAGSRRLASRR